MPAYQFDQSQTPAQTQSAAPVREYVHTAVTVTTDRTIQAQSAAELQTAEQAIRKDDHSYGFAI